MLSVDPSSLCKILNGKRSITPLMFNHLTAKLGLGPAETEALRPKAPQGSTIEFKPVAYDLFEIIADWYHYAILELAQLSAFDPDPKWISQRLGVSPQEVRIAIERLQRAGFIRIEADGKWVIEQASNTTVSNNFTTIAFRKLQRQILEMGIQALEEIPFERRDQTSMTMAMDSSLLPEAKERIKTFRRELASFLASTNKCDEVYHLAVSLYPVTQPSRSLLS